MGDSPTAASVASRRSASSKQKPSRSRLHHSNFSTICSTRDLGILISTRSSAHSQELRVATKAKNHSTKMVKGNRHPALMATTPPLESFGKKSGGGTGGGGGLWGQAAAWREPRRGREGGSSKRTREGKRAVRGRSRTGRKGSRRGRGGDRHRRRNG